MNLYSLKKWIYDRINDSLTDPSTIAYPRNACSGTLFRAGFTASNTILIKNRPPTGIVIEPKPSIVINLPYLIETQKTMGGSNGEKESEQKVEIDILWNADFSGNPATSLAPEFTSQELSSQKFNYLLMALLQTLRLSVELKKDAVSIPGGASFKLIDPVLGYKSFIRGFGKQMEMYAQEPELAENNADYTYGALIVCYYCETFRPADQPGV